MMLREAVDCFLVGSLASGVQTLSVNSPFLSTTDLRSHNLLQTYCNICLRTTVSGHKCLYSRTHNLNQDLTWVRTGRYGKHNRTERHYKACAYVYVYTNSEWYFLSPTCHAYDSALHAYDEDGRYYSTVTLT